MLEKYVIIRALEIVLSNPNIKFSVNGLAKTAKIAPSAAKYSLDYMFKQDLITRNVVGRTYQYQANLLNGVCRQWKILFSLQHIHESKLIENLKKTPTVTNITLYGSVAMGIDDNKSDIDILVIVTATRSHSIELTEIAGRELNISMYSPMEWRKKAKRDKAFYDNVVLNSISLFGEKPVVI